MSNAEINKMRARQAELEALLAEKNKVIEVMQEKGTKALFWKKSVKGAVSVYGLNARFPVSLYASQWLRLFEKAGEIKTWIEANKDNLPQSKEESKALQALVEEHNAKKA